MERDPVARRPSRAMWSAWACAFLGGVLVVAAAVTALTRACLRTATCDAEALSAPGYLAMAGTALAVGGGITATVLLLRRR